jgi:hypothetical protein
MPAKGSKLLFDEQPIVISRALAKVIGLNEAIILQQIHYWIEVNRKANTNFKDGRYWTYNSIKKWHDNDFSFWSASTVKRTFASLKDKGLLIVSNYNKAGYDRTKWYSIDYDKLKALDLAIDPNWTNGLTRNEPTNTIDYTEMAISGQVGRVHSPSALHSVAPETFEKKPKKDNIFNTATERFGEERCRDALGLIDKYIDEWYPAIKGRPHTTLSKAQRMSFATKLLECENETGLNLGYEIHNALVHAVKYSDCNPLIMYATTPQVLGYWLLKQEDVGYESVHHTDYEPVGTYY